MVVAFVGRQGHQAGLLQQKRLGVGRYNFVVYSTMQCNAERNSSLFQGVAKSGQGIPREYYSLMYLPNLEELSLRTVLEFPKASRIKLLSSKNYRCQGG